MADGPRQDEPAAVTGRVADLDGLGDAGGAESASAPVARFGELGEAEPAGGVTSRSDQAEPGPDDPVARGGPVGRDGAVGPVDLGQLDTTEARPVPPVAAFAEDAPGAAGAEEAGPVALFDTEELGSDRADVTVAELGPGAVRRRSGRGGSRSGGDRDPDDRPRGGSRRARRADPGRARRADPEGDGRTGRSGGTGARKGTPAHPVAVPDTVEPAGPGGADAGDQPAPDDRADDQADSRGRSGGRRGAGRRAGGREELDPDADPLAVAREVCLRLLTDRARTRQELAQALRRKGVPDDAANSVLERFDEVGLIDDAAFAGQWVRSRHTQRGLARRAIAVELRRKGVSEEDAGEALAEVDTDSEERRARELVDRKLRSLAIGTAEKRAAAGRRLVGMLARKGYGPGVAYRVVKEALADRGAETDELGDAEPPED